eukprot:Trichotokara_eunicae@DN3530_c0_g1_i2.p1
MLSRANVAELPGGEGLVAVPSSVPEREVTGTDLGDFGDLADLENSVVSGKVSLRAVSNAPDMPNSPYEKLRQKAEGLTSPGVSPSRPSPAMLPGQHHFMSGSQMNSQVTLDYPVAVVTDGGLAGLEVPLK